MRSHPPRFGGDKRHLAPPGFQTQGVTITTTIAVSGPRYYVILLVTQQPCLRAANGSKCPVYCFCALVSPLGSVFRGLRVLQHRKLRKGNNPRQSGSERAQRPVERAAAHSSRRGGSSADSRAATVACNADSRKRPKAKSVVGLVSTCAGALITERTVTRPTHVPAPTSHVKVSHRLLRPNQLQARVCHWAFRCLQADLAQRLQGAMPVV